MFIEKKCFFIVMLCFLVTLLFFPCLGAQEPSENTPSIQSETESTQGKVSEEKQPHITIDADTYDAGTIYEGDSVSHSFTVQNTGTAELAIHSVKAG
jgi:hypothetical protein